MPIPTPPRQKTPSVCKHFHRKQWCYSNSFLIQPLKLLLEVPVSVSHPDIQKQPVVCVQFGFCMFSLWWNLCVMQWTPRSSSRSSPRTTWRCSGRRCWRRSLPSRRARSQSRANSPTVMYASALFLLPLLLQTLEDMSQCWTSSVVVWATWTPVLLRSVQSFQVASFLPACVLGYFASSPFLITQLVTGKTPWKCKGGSMIFVCSAFKKGVFMCNFSGTVCNAQKDSLESVSWNLEWRNPWENGRRSM